MRYPETIQEYQRVAKTFQKMPPKEAYEYLRYFFRTDLYFLLRYGFNRRDMEHPWLLARCKEVQNNPDGYIDLWARDHYKSTIITYALTIQDILASYGKNPLPKWKGHQPTIAIFSHTRPIAKSFLRQIKREFEANDLLKFYFPDIIWQDTGKSTKWSEDDGLILIRDNNPKEASLEAWGLVEGQPTSRHFDIMIYDDVVTMESVQSPNMIRKTLDHWEMSINLGSTNTKMRHIGTRYHFNDLYHEIIKRKAAIPRIYKATDDGTMYGKPVFKTEEWIQERRIKLGANTFATQMLQNPLADEKIALKKEWLNFYKGSDGSGLNIYEIVDPASEKKKSSDYTSIWVIGLGSDNNYYVLDLIRDRLNLYERADAVIKLHRKWRPINVGYEKYGMQADIEYLKERMDRENYHFHVVELGGQMPKIDRIKRLVPSFTEGRWYFPESIFRTDYEGNMKDLVDVYINEEFLTFPVSAHDDMLDCQARILEPDLNALFPRLEHDDDRDRYNRPRKKQGSAWAR